jgi:hypothetical protein
MMSSSRKDIPMKRVPVTLVILLVFTAPVLGSVVEHTYTFDSPQVVAVGDYHFVHLDECYPLGKIGHPTLPFRSVELLLPPGEAVSWVEIEKSDPVTLPGTLRLFPQQPVRPTSSPALGTLVIDQPTYESDVALPRDSAFPFRTQYANGLAIAVGCFTPVTYIPRSGMVTYYRTVVVQVHTEGTDESRRSLEMLPASQRRLQSAAAPVHNPEVLNLYSAEPELEGEYDYLIITKATYEDDFQPLVDFYDRRGIRTRVKTVEFINSNYAGDDTAERVRACITDEYQNRGIQWVLLGGDADGEHDNPSGKIVPYRGLYCIVYSSDIYEDDHIPADCYYAGLDGNWNADGDNRWGEPGEEDFYGEVSVGRAPLDSEAEIATFITKTIRYQSAPVTGEVRNVLLLGEYLWDDPLTWGGDYMDELVGFCTNNGFTTQGVPPSYSIQKLYDKTTGWDMYDLMAEVNTGTHLINHLGHANTWYDMKMWDTDVTDANFLNDGITHSYCIVYTQGCLAGAFDNYYGEWYSDDCISEDMLDIDNFAVAVISNSRYGWFTEGSTNGPSQHYHREFIDALFGEGITTVGAANRRSKDETVPFVDLPDEYEPGAHRWCFYCSNLLGDPVMDVWTDAPGTMTVNAPDEIDRNATSVEVETGVGGALVALSWDGILYGRAYAHPSGDAEVVFSRPIASLDMLELVVTAHNYLTFEEQIVVTDVTSASGDPLEVADWALAPCTPNPFSRETTIQYSIRNPSHVSLRIFGIQGRSVAHLVEGTQPAGRHQQSWTPDPDLAPGIYLCELRAGEFRAVKKMLIVR